MSDLKDICPICEDGRLQPKIGSNSVDYRGRHTNLDVHYSVCDECGSEQADAVQLRENKRSMVKFRKTVDCLLTGSQVRSIRKKLGLSQAEAARIFGGGPVAFSKYESDDVAQSEAMDKLLRTASTLPEAMNFLSSLVTKSSTPHQTNRRFLNINSPHEFQQLHRPGTAYGVDGCGTGWFCFAIHPNKKFDAFTIKRLEELVAKAGANDRIFVDIPIGFSNGREERLCDKEARSKLGCRGRTVFRTPVRQSLSAIDYAEAKEINQRYSGKSLSIQTWSIVPKIKEVDNLLRNSRKARLLIREVHPEICFWALAGGRHMEYSKKQSNSVGIKERVEVLNRINPSLGNEYNRMLNKFPRRNVAKDDILDAMAAAITAMASPEALRTLPEYPSKDSSGLPMEMVYYFHTFRQSNA